MTLVSFLVCFFSLVSAIVQCIRIHQSRLFRREFTGAWAILVVCIGSLISSISGFPGQTYVQLTVFFVLLSTTSILVLRELVHPSGKSGTLAPLIPAFVSLVLFFINSMMNAELPTGHLLARSVAIMALASVGILVTVCNANLRDFANLYLLSLFSVLSITPAIANAWRPCDQFKCGSFGAIYTGPFSSENLLGQLTVVGLLFTMSFWSTIRSPLALLTLGIVLLATESRTSQIVFGLVVVTFLIMNSQLRRYARKTRQNTATESLEAFGAPRAWALLPLLALTATFLTAFYLLLSATPSSLSNRGNVWIRGLRALDDSWLFGLGLDRWSSLQESGLVPRLYPHSEYLLMLFSGGMIGILMLYGMLFYSLIQATKELESFAFGVSFVLLFALFGLTEITWNPITVDITLLMVAPIFFILNKPRIPRTAGKGTARGGLKQGGF